MAVRAKVVCNYKAEQDACTQIVFGPVYEGSAENKEFFASTPGLNLQLYCVNPEASKQFELGQEYYLDFSKAE